MNIHIFYKQNEVFKKKIQQIFFWRLEKGLAASKKYKWEKKQQQTKSK